MPRRTLLLGLCLGLMSLPAGSAVAQPSTSPPTCSPITQPSARQGAPQLLRGRWRELPAAPIGYRDDPVVVWTGAELLVWGGVGRARRTGAAYEPIARHWRSIAAAPMVPDPSIPAVWTGTELLVWGGRVPGTDRFSWPRNVAAAYDPAADAWRIVASPEGASGPTTDLSAWTGTEMLAWGWFEERARPRARLLAYSPATDTWRQAADAPVSPGTGTMTWTGSELVVVGYGGAPDYDGMNAHAATYTPTTDAWRDLGRLPMSGDGMPTAHATSGSVLLMNAYQWPDESVAVGEPANHDLVLDPVTGCGYAPTEAPWTSSTGSPSAWTGSLLLFPGDRGLAYAPSTDDWKRLPRERGLRQPMIGSATWAGGRLFVLGGPFLAEVEPRRARPLRPAYEFIPAP